MNTQELIEANRYTNVDYDWWEDEYDIFIEKMEERGITIVDKKDINFSGFYSQGDGASFTGYIHRSDLARFMEHHKLCEDYAPTYYLAKKDEIDIKLVRRHSMYCHSNTIGLEMEDMGASDTFDKDSGDVREAILSTMYEQYYLEASKFETEVLELCRNYMDQLYRQLEEQFEYLTSDEAVLESLEMNNQYIPQKQSS